MTVESKTDKFKAANEFTCQRLEAEIVLLCARTKADESTLARLETLTSSTNVDWSGIYEFARRHSIIPLVYLQLNEHAANVPAEQLARFRKNYQDNAARNLFLTGDLCRILDALEENGIEAVPYKGPALAISAYGELGLRRFVDLDILVRKANVTDALEVLRARGFACDTDWTKTQQTILLRTQHNLSLSREEHRLIVELHWEVASSDFAASLQAEEFWDRLETITLNGKAVKSLAIEDLVLSLCVHGSKHFWERLGWICDVAELLRRRNDLNWKVLLQRAAASGNQRMLFLGLHLAAKLLNAPLPDTVKSSMAADKVAITLGEEVENRLFAGVGQTPTSLREGFTFHWKLRDSWRARFRYCRLLIQPTDADIEQVRLPRLLSFGYYLIRPLGLLKRDRDRRLAMIDHFGR